MYPTTETAQRADLVLPAAGWGEKEGTFINSERRIGLVKKVARAPGQALSDFNIFKLIAHYWGCGAMFAAWSSPEAVFQILKEISRGQPCDITGIADYRMLDECGGVQWPWTEDDEARRSVSSSEPSSFQERRLFEDGRFFHDDARARFWFEEPQPRPKQSTRSFHSSCSRAAAVPRNGTRRRAPESPTCCASSARRTSMWRSIRATRNAFGIGPNTQVRIRSRRGEIVATAFVTATVQVGQVFLPMHYVVVNQLTNSIFDPYSRQPSYKWTCVAIEPVTAC